MSEDGEKSREASYVARMKAGLDVPKQVEKRLKQFIGDVPKPKEEVTAKVKPSKKGKD